MSVARKIAVPLGNFISIRIGSVTTDHPLPYDLYIVVNQKPTCIRKKGETISLERVRSLLAHGGKEFLVPRDQREVYLGSLRDIIRDPDTSSEVKSRYIKESAFVHVNDLFTAQDIQPVLGEAKNLVEEMVNFVSTDVQAVTSLMRLSTHDYYTYNHCVDVAVYSISIAKRVFGEDKKSLIFAGLGGLLHDIGKRNIDWNVINKATPLTQPEWEEIKRHPEYGRDYLQKIATIPQEVHNCVYQHHENFDGTGYPEKISEEDISKLARVVSVADVFDALTTNRSYHKAVGPKDALDTMFSMQPGKFDPDIFKIFNKNFSKKGVATLEKGFDPCELHKITKIKPR